MSTTLLQHEPTLTNVPIAALAEAVRCLQEIERPEFGVNWSVAMNQDGSLFVTAATRDARTPCAFKWAFIRPDGSREWTPWCEESAIREACRIGVWRLDVLLEDSSKSIVEEFGRPSVSEAGER